MLDNKDGTVLDKKTNLTWQKCSAGLNNDATCTGTASTYTWTNTISYCTGLSLAGKNWRLPNVNELKSIADYSLATSPAINTTIFPATVVNFYWSSTSIIAFTSNAWSVYDGYVNYNNGV